MPGFLIQNDTVCTASDETPPRVAMTTRRVSFEVALFKTGEDQRGENTGNYHNPTRQRGISRNTAQKRKSTIPRSRSGLGWRQTRNFKTDASVWDRHKCATCPAGSAAYFENKASTNPSGSNSSRSSTCSPTPMYLTGNPISCRIATATPPRAVPSSLERIRPVHPIA
jgi:hypothetical protein